MEYNATIIKIEETNHKLKEFTIKLDESENEEPFKAGQFAMIGLKDEEGNLIRRAYSIVSAPQDGDRHFYIVLKYTEDIYDDEARPRAFTPILFRKKEGDRIFMSPKSFGHFTMDLSPNAKQLIFVSTGTGLAPFRGMLRAHPDLLKRTKITLLHGVRTEDALGYVNELKELENKYPDNFSYFSIVSRPKGEWNGDVGRVTKILESDVIEKSFGEGFGEDTHVYFCGSKQMIIDSIDILVKKGIPSGNMHKEVQ